MCSWDYTRPCMGDRCPRRAQCEAAKQAAYANNGGNGNNNRRHNNNGDNNNRRHNNGNNSGNNNRRMPQPPPYYGPQGGNIYMTVNNITVNNFQQPQQNEGQGLLDWLQGKFAAAIGGRSAAEAMFKGQLPTNH